MAVKQAQVSSSHRSAAFVALSAVVHLGLVLFFVMGSRDETADMIGDQQIEVQFVLADDIARSPVTARKVRAKEKPAKIEVPRPLVSATADAPLVANGPVEEAPSSPASNKESVAETVGPHVSSGVGTGSAIASAEAGYLSEIRKLLESNKEYPLAARRMGHRGRVVVRFIVERDGHVREAKILQASQSEILNRAARRLIEKIQGLKPFPSEIALSEWAVVVPIEYQM